MRRDSISWVRAAKGLAASLICATVTIGVAPVAADAAAASFHPEVVLVGFRPDVQDGRRYAIERAAGGLRARHLGPMAGLSVKHGRSEQRFVAPLALRVPAGQVLAVVNHLRREPGVVYAEPDYRMQADATPNDPSFPLQWGDSNSGQAIPTQNENELLGAPAGGTPGADDGALKAWGVSTGSASIVIGEADTGVDFEHPDLAANIWSNPGGVGGCAAGTHGYDVLTSSCNPMDDDTVYGGHGTHVAGIMGALGNNATGVTGINWHTSILPVKWLNSSAWGETSGLIEALQWLLAAKQAGVNVRVVNDSATFAGTASSKALSEEIDILGANNILFVTAAGNSGMNNDEESIRRYPCGYDRPTEICVTASNNLDRLPSWANYGPHTVDLAAPGVSIYSTLREGKYGYLSGGSMASPQVAGAAALILSVDPSLSATELKADILGNVDPLPSFAGKLITGGRLDVCKALPGCQSSQAPFGTTSIGTSVDGGMFANYKIVNTATLSASATVSRLNVYAVPGSASPSPQALKAVIYSDSGGSPGALIATGTEVTYRGTVNGKGWFELPFASPVTLPPGTYWLGFITGNATLGMGYAYSASAASRAYNQNSYTSGPTTAFGSATKDSELASLYATYTPAAQGHVPVNSTTPTVTGTATTGQTLKASAGSWTEGPTSYTYQWQRCNSGGEGCAAISGASTSSYLLGTADVGATLRVSVIASNASGPSAAAVSIATAVVQQTSAPATFGKTSIGASYDAFAANRKRVNRYALPLAGQVSKLSIYLAPTGTSGQQMLEGVLYSDASGKPSSLLGTTSQLTFKSTNAAGWYELKFPTPLSLPAGNYWIGAITGATSDVAGFRYDTVAGSRAVNSNTYTSGPSSAFGEFSTDAEQSSLYATYTAG